MSIPVSEKSNLTNDGSVRGIDYELSITGNPQFIAAAIKQLIAATFQVNESAICGYRFLNMPGKYYRPTGQEPRKLSSEEFMMIFDDGKHAYLGEQSGSIFLIPNERATELPVSLGAEVLFTDVRELEPGDIVRIRESQR